jgi:hypothetical protein
MPLVLVHSSIVSPVIQLYSTSAPPDHRIPSFVTWERRYARRMEMLETPIEALL